MDINTIVGGGLVLTVAGSLLMSLKNIPKILYTKFKNRFIHTVRIYQYDDLFYVLEKWLYKYHQNLYRDVEAHMNNFTSNDDSPNGHKKKEKETIKYKQEGNTFILKYDGKRLLVTKNKEKNDKVQNVKDRYFSVFTIEGFKAKDYIDRLLADALADHYKDLEDNSIEILTNSQWGEWRRSNRITVKPLDNVIINSELKELIINDLEDFEKTKDWYVNLGIPYKRAYCFYGPPGTGKTSLSLSIAAKMKRDVYCLNLNSLENDADLCKTFSFIAPNSVLLIEDMDKIFSGRESINHKISFSALLNCLDGALYKQGTITIITTNHLDKLDEALIREGRVDLKVPIDNPTYFEISEYLSLFYDKSVLMIDTPDISMSKVQEICLRNKNSLDKAITELYKECGSETIDE